MGPNPTTDVLVKRETLVKGREGHPSMVEAETEAAIAEAKG